MQSSYNFTSICSPLTVILLIGVYIDYRYFDSEDIEPRYPFGHGLSYTNFTYSNMKVDNPYSNLTAYPTGELSVGGYSDLWDMVSNISVEVSNTGSVDGAEVPQLYIGYPSMANQPIRQLRGFERVEIEAGGQTTTTFSLRRRDISYWDVVAQKWAVAAGQYNVYVGASSRDLRLNGSMTVELSS